MMTIDDFQKAFAHVQKEMRRMESDPPDATGHVSLDAYCRGIHTGELAGMNRAARIFFACIRVPSIKVDYKDTKNQVSNKGEGGE